MVVIVMKTNVPGLMVKTTTEMMMMMLRRRRKVIGEDGDGDATVGRRRMKEETVIGEAERRR